MTALSRASACEFLGTFMLTFFGVGSIILATSSPPIGGLVTVALAHGLVLGAMVTACMAISGGQFNPAVSIALSLIGTQPPRQAAAFIVAQLMGSASAAGMWQLVLTPEVANAEGPRLGATIGSLTLAGNVVGVLAIEAILTFALMISILAGTVDARAHKLGGFTIGLTVAACILAAGPLTGASMNPARSFGPAVCGSHWTMFWAYVVGPVAGACLGAVAYRAIWRPEKG